VDLHLRGLDALGAELRMRKGYVIARAPQLRGAEIDLSGPMGPTVTGTANIMSAAVLARGRTVIRGAAQEPEIVDLGRFLKALGARIDGLGTPTVEIEGVDLLTQRESYTVIPDRVEAATLLMAVATAGGRGMVVGVEPQHLTAVLGLLDEMGARLNVDRDRIAIESSPPLRSFSAAAMPYPKIPTDVQPLLAVAAAVATGRSRIRDNVFPSRWLHIDELQRLGVTARLAGNEAIVDGRAGTLNGTCVTARDLRGAAALVLAGVAAKGTTTIRGIHHLDRGYQDLDQKLSALGADVERRATQRGRESFSDQALFLGKSG
jgi:UDP-N-acetylglucosamine 1-carboxyvinyltransferase